MTKWCSATSKSSTVTSLMQKQKGEEGAPASKSYIDSRAKLKRRDESSSYGCGWLGGLFRCVVSLGKNFY